MPEKKLIYSPQVPRGLHTTPFFDPSSALRQFREDFRPQEGTDTINDIERRIYFASQLSETLLAAASSEQTITVNFGPDQFELSAQDVLRGMQYLLGSKPQYKSTFLLDAQIIEGRLTLISQLLPLSEALALNPTLEQYNLKELTNLLVDLVSNELFPAYGEVGKNIPVLDVNLRFQFGQAMIALFNLLAQHLNVGGSTLDKTMTSLYIIYNYPKFDRDQKRELLRQGFLTPTSVCANPNSNPNHHQYALGQLLDVFNPESPVGKGLTKEDKLSLAEDTIANVEKIVTNGREYPDYVLTRVFNLLETACFCDEYTTEEKLQLLPKSLSILKEIALRHCKEDQIKRELFNFLDFVPDVNNLDYLVNLVEAISTALASEKEQDLSQEKVSRPKISEIIAESPVAQKLTNVYGADEIAEHILILNPFTVKDPIERLNQIKNIIEGLRERQGVGPIPELVLTLPLDDPRREELLTKIQEIIETILSQSKSNHSLEEYLFRPLQTFYWLYSKLPYQKPPAK
jgi:hypothetical protein